MEEVRDWKPKYDKLGEEREWVAGVVHARNSLALSVLYLWIYM